MGRSGEGGSGEAGAGNKQRERDIVYSPLPSQKRFHESTARFKGFSGPIGSGKSQALCQEALKLSYLNPGRTGLIGAPTYPMLRDATAAALLEVLDRNKIPHELNRAENFVTIRETRSKILFRAVEEFERLRGSNLAWFGLDELTYTAEQAWLRLEGRLRDPKATRLTGFAVWTPRGYDWVYDRFVARKVEGYETVLAAPFENRHLLERVPDYYERLRGSYDARFFEQEVLGQYVNLQAGRVYYGFERAGNVEETELNRAAPLRWALDFNFDPMSSVIAQLDGDKVRVLDEIVLRRATTLQACEEFARRYPKHGAGVVVYMSFWASASGNVLTITARIMGAAGDANTLSVASSDPSVWTLTASGTTLTGGADGTWLTDLTASPRLNRAARDWTTSFFTALNGYGIDTTASLSMELGNGDPSVTAGIAQRGPSPGGGTPGAPILLPTPSLQTNFSPTSLAFWQEVYLELAAIQAGVGLTPFLQFGEVQWWYFPNNGLPAGDGLVDYGGMPFYDDWTQSQFLTDYGTAMATITTNTVNPASYPNESTFLPGLIGNFTNAIISFVQASQPASRFEVLWPVDVNQTSFNQAINYPAAAWTPSILNVLKTEGFGFTLGRTLDGAETAMADSHGFPASQRSHLVGIGDPATAWVKEAQSAVGKGFESVVLFALDQMCLIGYELPLPTGLRRSFRVGR